MNENEEDDYAAPKIKSFDVLAATRGIKYRFKVNVVSTHGRIPNLQFGYHDSEPAKFDSLIFIVMKDDPPEFPYVLQLITLESSRGNIIMKFVDVVSEKLDPSNRTVFLRFKKDRGIEIKFRFDHDYYLFKVFLELLHYTIGDRKNVPSTEDIPKLSFIHIEEESIRQKKAAKKKSVSHQGLSVNISAKRRTRKYFYETHSRDWKEREVQEWFDHILMTKNPVVKVTVLSKLRENKALYPLLNCMFEDYETFPSIEALEEEQKSPLSSYGPILRLHKTIEMLENGDDDDDEEENEGEHGSEGFESGDLKTIVSELDLDVRNRIGDALDLLMNYWDGYFSIPFYRAFLKFLATLKKNSPTPIETIEKYFLLQRKPIWDAEDCRDNILLTLLFNDSFKSVILNWENDFAEQMQIRFSETKITAEAFDELLDEFNKRHHGIKMENICHAIHIYWKQNNLRKKRKEMIKELQQLQEDIEKKRGEGREARDRAEENLRKIGVMKKKQESIEDLNSTVYKVITKQIKRLDDNNVEIKTKVLKKNDEEVQRLRIQMHSHERKIYKKKQEIVSILDEKNRYEEGVFYSSKKFRKEVKKLIDSKFDEFNKNSQLFQTKVKLVLAYKKEKEGEEEQPPQQQQQQQQQPGEKPNLIKDVMTEMERVSIRGLQKLLDPIFNPDFFKFGLTHSYVLIKNLRFDWFDNGFVYVEDMKVKKKFMNKFETIACIDCDVPMVNVNSDTLRRMIHQLAEEIVFWNSRIQYTPFTLSPQTYKKNCQEFTIEMLRNLGGGPMYPKTRQYLEEIKDFLSVKHKEKKEIHQFRVVDFSNDQHFNETFGEKIIKSKKFDHMMSRKRPGKVFFRTHAELDDFVHALEEVDIDFSINFPGLHQVLKSFDRAYWLNKIENRNPDSKTDDPSEDGCPFTQNDGPNLN